MYWKSQLHDVHSLLALLCLLACFMIQWEFDARCIHGLNPLLLSLSALYYMGWGGVYLSFQVGAGRHLIFRNFRLGGVNGGFRPISRASNVLCLN